MLVGERLQLDGVDDGSYVSLTFPPLGAVKGAQLRLELALEDLAAAHAFGLYTTASERDHPTGALRVDGVETDADLHFRAYRARATGDR